MGGNLFDYAVLKGDALFTAIIIGIRSVLDFLELQICKNSMDSNHYN